MSKREGNAVKRPVRHLDPQGWRRGLARSRTLILSPVLVVQSVLLAIPCALAQCFPTRQFASVGDASVGESQVGVDASHAEDAG